MEHDGFFSTILAIFQDSLIINSMSISVCSTFEMLITSLPHLIMESIKIPILIHELIL